jgi:ectoine hydroxylase-related dioxygenase (phytanoyl-CoA dioxygenase family)
MLTQEQIDQFHRDGYLKSGRVISDEQVGILQEEMERVIRDKDADVPQPVLLHNMGREDAQIWQIVNIWEASRPFEELIHNPRIGEEMAQLTGANELRVWHDQIQYKPASMGGVNMWHQDAPYWPIIAPMNEVSAWVALDDVDEENGCMSMVPGSHLWGNQIDFIHTLKSFDAMPSEYQGHPVEVRLRPVRKGEVHFHHALTWHGSHANKSARPRRAIAIHFMLENTRYVASGEHPMKPFVEVEDGELLKGKHFPLVYQREAVPA